MNKIISFNKNNYSITVQSGCTLFNIKNCTEKNNTYFPLNLPSKEGLNVAARISILYHLKEDKALDIISTVGKKYEDVLILSTFRSAAADVCARFYAKDMHSGKRAEIEKEIKDQMSEILKGRGFEIEAILLKSITLPNQNLFNGMIVFNYSIMNNKYFSIV